VSNLEYWHLSSELFPEILPEALLGMILKNPMFEGTKFRYFEDLNNEVNFNREMYVLQRFVCVCMCVCVCV